MPRCYDVDHGVVFGRAVCVGMLALLEVVGVDCVVVFVGLLRVLDFGDKFEDLVVCGFFGCVHVN